MEGKKIIALEVAKWLLVLGLLVMLYSLLSTNHISNADFETVRQAVSDAADLSTMAEGDNQTFKRLYGLDAADYEDIFLYYPTTNMGAEELLLVKLTDTAQQETLKAAIESRVQTQMNSFEGYGVDQYAMLENSVIEVQGNYVLFVSAADPSPIRRAFLGAL